MKKIVLLPMVLFLLTSVGFSQQIPNNDLETWSSAGNGMENPNSWGTSNYYYDYEIGSVTFNTVIKNTSSYSGTNCAKLVNVNNPIPLVGSFVFPGLITLGTFAVDISATPPAEVSGGVPFTSRPTSFRGYYKYTPAGNDSAFFGVGFSSATTADTIGTAYMYESGTVTEWTLFNIPIEWTTGDNPDSMNIVILSGDVELAVEGSTLYIDSLWFDYSPITTVKESVTRNNIVEVFPNPTTNKLTIDLGTSSKSVQVAVYNTLGTKVMESSFKDVLGQVNLTTSTLESGIYLVKIQSDEIKTVVRIVIQ